MKITNITSHQQLISELKKTENNYVLIYKKGTENSNCAFEAITKAEENNQINIFGIDVTKTTDIHKNYSVKSAPTLLEFKFDKIIKDTKGCNTPNFYNSLFEKSLYIPDNPKNKKQNQQVTVYSTPTCSWCTRLKNYLDEHKIKYQDIDVSKDQKAAQNMVKKSGQQGVPQIEINGQIIVGFDKNKIDNLLKIK